MRLLLDTNVLIPGEPLSTTTVAGDTAAVVELLQWAQKGTHQVIVHPAVGFDLDRDGDEARRQLRRLLFGKYLELTDPPPVPAAWVEHVGAPERGTNDWVDNQLLAALSRNAVGFLVTEDRGIHRKAKRVGVDRQVCTVRDMIATLRSFAGETIAPPPAVRQTVVHAFDVQLPFFNSLHTDYGPTFLTWFAKCQAEQRACWTIDGDGAEPAALCIFKDEVNESGFHGKTLKLCLFKVDDASRGRRLGELLLKTAFAHAAANRHEVMYVTVFPRHERVVDLFGEFGFEYRETKANGELVLFKCLRPPYVGVDALQLHVRHGPPLFAVDAADVFVVPIEPRYHHLLFPDAEAQLALAPGAHPFGNGLRKAYLCRASTRSLPPGSPLLFYRSEQGQHVRVIGVVEASVRSAIPDEIAAFVGKRTVYPLRDIEKMCSDGEVLAFLFRQAVVLNNPIALTEFLEDGALKGPPQSITRMKSEARAWFRQRLEQSSCFPFGLSTPNPS